MKNQKLPPFELWRSVNAEFRRRLASPQTLQQLNDCIDRQFMTAQAICRGVRRPSEPLLTAKQLIREFTSELGPVISALDLRFQAECFGQFDAKRFNDSCFLALWCLTLEIATTATAGSVVEMSVGTLQSGLEVEIGSDCKSLEQHRVLDSASFEFVDQLISISRALNLKCPLGGVAVQLNIPVDSMLAGEQAA